MTFGDTETLGQEFDEVAIGLSVNRRRGDADLEAVCSVRADDLILAGARLYVNVQKQLIVLPLVPPSHISQ